jgi:hypothetical protein
VDVVSPAGEGVYFIRGAGLTKIGTSATVAQRVANIQACSPVELELVRFEPLAAGRRRWVETALHEAFGEYRRRGEWFDLPDDWQATADAVITDALVVWESA